MRLFKPLFFRYLLRQQLIILVVSFCVCVATNFTIILASRGERDKVTGIILLIVIIGVWFFPIYLSVVSLITYFSYKKLLLQIGDEKALFNKMTNKIIRELVVKNGIKVSIFTDKKTDFDHFNSVINDELKFQRKKIELLKGN